MFSGLSLAAVSAWLVSIPPTLLTHSGALWGFEGVFVCALLSNKLLLSGQCNSRRMSGSETQWDEPARAK